MKTHDRMNDAQRKESWRSVTDLTEAVDEMLAHQQFAASSDPYYGDMTAALWEMLGRCREATVVRTLSYGCVTSKETASRTAKANLQNALNKDR